MSASVHASRRGLLSTNNADKAFISTGFRNWKEQRAHKEAVQRLMEIPKSTSDVDEAAELSVCCATSRQPGVSPANSEEYQFWQDRIADWLSGGEANGLVHQCPSPESDHKNHGIENTTTTGLQHQGKYSSIMVDVTTVVLCLAGS